MILALVVAGPMLVAPVASWASGCKEENLRAALNFTRLPDCRSYELVSPPAKNGWSPELLSATGSRVIMQSFGAFAGSDQRGFPNFYEVERSPVEGWATFPFIEPAEQSGLFLPLFEGNPVTSGDLGEALFAYAEVNTERRERNFYLSALPMSGSGIVDAGPVVSHAAVVDNPPGSEEETSLPSASEDLSTIVFELGGPTGPGIGAPKHYLWPGDTTVENTGPLYGKQAFMSLYEFTGRTLSAAPAPAPALVGVSSGGQLIGQCGVSLGSPTEGIFSLPNAGGVNDSYNVISSDGSHVFFTVAAATQGPSGDACTGEGTGRGPLVNELYARIDASKTVAISEPSSEDCAACNTTEAAQKEAPEGPEFQGASQNGSKVLFLSAQMLLSGALQSGAEGTNLYEYDFDAERGKRVSLIAPDVLGVARLSADGSHIYFVSHDKLTNEPNPVGDVAYKASKEEEEAGEDDNLYVFQEEHIAFVGKLSGGDAEDWRRRDVRPFEATPDGRFTVFDSSSDLTHEQSKTGGTQQVYEYAAGSAGNEPMLVRVSSGVGGRALYGSEIVKQRFEEQQNPAPKLGSISENGTYVVFRSMEALTSEAAVGVQNVYEYSEGHVSLISDGQDRSGGTSLLGMDGSGEDIFFTSADRLVPQDGDTQVDIYDARVNGGFPAPLGQPECDGEGCQGTQSVPPLLPTPGSVSQPPGERVVEPSPARSVTTAGKTTAGKTTPKKKGKAKRRTTGARRAGTKAKRRVKSKRAGRQIRAAIRRAR